MKNKEFDWFKWAELKETDHDKLISNAKKKNIPIFDSDTSQDIYNRLLAVKTYRFNINTVIINLILTVVSIISATISIFG